MKLTNEFGSANLIHQAFVMENMNYIIMDDILYFQVNENNNHYQAILNTKEICFTMDDLCVVGRCKEVGKTTYNTKYLELKEKYFHLVKEVEERLFVFVISDIMNMNENEKRLSPFFIYLQLL